MKKNDALSDRLRGMLQNDLAFLGLSEGSSRYVVAYNDAISRCRKLIQEALDTYGVPATLKKITKETSP